MSLALGIRGHLPKFSQSDFTCSSVLFPLNSLVVNEHLLNKLLAFSIEKRAEEFTRKLKLLQLKSFPCDLTVAGLKQLVSNDLESSRTSLVLHRKSPHCTFPAGKVQCSISDDKVFLLNVIRALGVNHSF
ncbi:hypothetical protein DPMN_020180 [Dreissena polymorpha]|uniref:Uncharacterized protein n=1 Tax=Dreissena polymorpha TaxID=45954 RepID=A0A9D4S7Z4_DREPO|nr:hypothetical protein DPMN_020180 [Dreissena polymorpha]